MTGTCSQRRHRGESHEPTDQCSRLIILVKELNLTTGGYYPSRVPFSRWHGFLCIVAVAPLPYINPRQSCLRFTIFLPSRADARRFRFRSSFQSAGAIASRSFRRSLRSLSLRYDNRCRSRCSRPRPRARRKRPAKAGTGTRRKRRRRGGNHEPTSCHSVPHRL